MKESLSKAVLDARKERLKHMGTCRYRKTINDRMD